MFIFLMTSCEKAQFVSKINNDWNASYDFTGAVTNYCEGDLDSLSSNLIPHENDGIMSFYNDSTGYAKPFMGFDSAYSFTWVSDGDKIIISLPEDGYSIDFHMVLIENEGLNKKTYEHTKFGVKGACWQEYPNESFKIILTK